jgi:PPOX class probable F420-dependent enzyme
VSPTPDASRIDAPVSLPADVRAFLSGIHYAVVGTVNPDGSPHTATTWYLFDDDTIVVNSREGRRWPENLRRDPRVSIAVQEGEDWVSLRGTVEIVGHQPQAQADIAAMARRYNEHGTAEEDIRDVFSTHQRVSFRLRPVAFHAEFRGS